MSSSSDSSRSDMPRGRAGHAVEIISINEEGTQFKLNEKNLVSVMERAEAINAERVCVVSVVGAFRTGKSFLLDLFIRYLSAGEDAGPAVGDAQTVPAWVSAGGDRLDEGNMQMDEEDRAGGFLWRGGQERTTTGIWLYDRPFARTLPSGERVAVVLMDTQGMFDLRTSGELTAAIFGLSTLISSHQIYNIVRQIQEDKLEQLDYFTQFSLVALKEFRRSKRRQREAGKRGGGDGDDDDKASEAGPDGDEKDGGGDDDDDAGEEDMHPFQRIDFLVRDWQNFEDPDELDACVESMEGVLKNAMDTKYSDRGTREQIRSAFDKIGCWLLPHPGLAVTKPKFGGEVDKIELSFLALLDHYCRRVFDEGVCAKKVQGREVSPRVLVRYIKAYASVFRDGRLPQTLTLVEAISSTNNLCAKDEAAAIYKRELSARTSGEDGLTDEEIAEADAAARGAAIQHYETSATFGDTELIEASRAELVRSMDGDLATATEANKHKIAGGMAVFVTPLVVAFFALVADKISDFTCDFWSETCRTLSNQLMLVYMGVLCALGYSMYQVYNDRGPMAVSVTMMALLNSAVRRVQEHLEHWRERALALRDEYLGAQPSSAAAAGAAAAGARKSRKAKKAD